MKPKLKRVLSFLLIPLSAVPFVAAVPLVAPSVDNRLDPPPARTTTQTEPRAPSLVDRTAGERPRQRAVER